MKIHKKRSKKKIKAIPLDVSIEVAFNEFNFLIPQVIKEITGKDVDLSDRETQKELSRIVNIFAEWAMELYSSHIKCIERNGESLGNEINDIQSEIEMTRGCGLSTKKCRTDYIAYAQLRLKAKLGNSMIRAVLVEGLRFFSQTVVKLAEKECNSTFEKALTESADAIKEVTREQVTRAADDILRKINDSCKK